MKLKIEITQNMIDTGIKHDAFACPVQKAIQAAIPQASFVSVTTQRIRYGIAEKIYTKKTPVDFITLIRRFDRGFVIKPIIRVCSFVGVK